MNTFSSNVSLETWLAAIASSACIGVTSLVPWLFNLTFFEQQKSTSQQESIESQLTELGSSSEVAERNVGVSMIAGIFLFIIVEMCLQKWSGQEAEPEMPEDDHKVNLKKTKKKEKKAEATKFNNNNNNHGDQDLNQYPTPDTLKKMASLLCRPSNETHHITTTKTTIPNGHSESHHQNHQEAFPLLATDISDQMNNNNNNNYLVGSLEDQNLINRKKSKVSAMPPTSKDDDENVCDPSPNNDGIDTTTKSNNKNLTIDPAGYLNLIANGFDNFTHGLAIGASFLVGMKVGILTTFVIFIHEIPHEICDYAILVKSGFSRWEAVKAQSSVSLFGIMGTTMALYVKSVEKLNAKTVWILPFSAGGFLYIALVTLLPDILDKQSNLRNSIGQVASVILGITFMGLVALL